MNKKIKVFLFRLKKTIELPKARYVRTVHLALRCHFILDNKREYILGFDNKFISWLWRLFIMYWPGEKTEMTSLLMEIRNNKVLSTLGWDYLLSKLKQKENKT